MVQVGEISAQADTVHIGPLKFRGLQNAESDMCSISLSSHRQPSMFSTFGYQIRHRRAPSAIELVMTSDLLVGLTFMETGRWLAVDNLVGEYGEGETCAAAVQALIVSLFEDRELLREHEDELAEPLKYELRRLDDSLLHEMLPREV